MKLNILRFLCIFAVFFLFFSCEGRKKISTDMLKDGDIIFQNKKSKSSELLTILSAPEFNHAGILLSRNGKWYVIEAAQPVELTPVSSWINSGDEDIYAIKRLKEADTIFNQENAEHFYEISKRYLGKPYDAHFAWSDDAFYSSELVWKIYSVAFNIELCSTQILGDFDLTSVQTRDKVKEVYGNKVPLYEEAVSLKALFNSSQLITIMDNSK
ncbi:MAG: hypothetical protein LBD46_04100 [Endomicrobium sp.]|jgi:uncharacterized protein YycO|nr:hypothetical protein [Endomicrobium sp.]